MNNSLRVSKTQHSVYSWDIPKVPLVAYMMGENR